MYNDTIATTEVRLDGTLIGTSDGSSFFDENRVAHLAYIYDVTFISIHNEQSDAFAIE